jgi:hypothetical protein
MSKKIMQQLVILLVVVLGTANLSHAQQGATTIIDGKSTRS